MLILLVNIITIMLMLSCLYIQLHNENKCLDLIAKYTYFSKQTGFYVWRYNRSKIKICTAFGKSINLNIVHSMLWNVPIIICQYHDSIHVCINVNKSHCFLQNLWIKIYHDCFFSKYRLYTKRYSTEKNYCKVNLQWFIVPKCDSSVMTVLFRSSYR